MLIAKFHYTDTDTNPTRTRHGPDMDKVSARCRVRVVEFSFKPARLELFAGLRETAPVFAALLRRDKLQAVLSKFEAKCTLSVLNKRRHTEKEHLKMNFIYVQPAPDIQTNNAVESLSSVRLHRQTPLTSRPSGHYARDYTHAYTHTHTHTPV